MQNLYIGSEPSSSKFMEQVADFESRLKFDSMTYQHSLNVANLSVQLSKQSPYDLDEVLVYYSGLFHDIGKSVMPLDILRKEDSLTEDEFRRLKEHPKQGFRILQQYRFPSEILFSALLHHEKYDGSGYPIGFIGKEIPAAARIVSICDVFDALTSDRTYRNAYSEQKALDIMEYSRFQFDPELLEIFCSRYEENKIMKFPVQALK